MQDQCCNLPLKMMRTTLAAQYGFTDATQNCAMFSVNSLVFTAVQLPAIFILTPDCSDFIGYDSIRCFVRDPQLFTDSAQSWLIPDF